jgi:hypothetical protein
MKARLVWASLTALLSAGVAHVSPLTAAAPQSGNGQSCTSRRPINVDDVGAPAKCRNRELWRLITEDPAPGTLSPNFALLSDTAFLNFTMTHDKIAITDVTQHLKATINTRGAVVRAKLQVKHSLGYTGVFQSGLDEIFLRFSPSAQNQTAPLGLGLIGIVEGGHVSSVLVNEGGTPNFFAQVQTNHVHRAAGATAGVPPAFFQVARSPEAVALSGWAQVDADGHAVNNAAVDFPWVMVLQPNPALAAEFEQILAANPGALSWSLLGQLDLVDQTLFKVYVFRTPTSTEPEYLGDITAKSNATTSKFGDERLFIRHDRIDLDIAYKPDWDAHFRQNPFLPANPSLPTFFNGATYYKLFLPPFTE